MAKPLSRRSLLTIGGYCISGLAHTQPGTAQSPSAKSLEEWIRRGYGAATESAQTSSASDAEEVWREIGWSGIGYGFRTMRPRQLSGEKIAQARQQFGTSMEYYRIELNEVHTAVDGDIGLVWGVHTEEFKQRGQPPETIRVRFTNTLRWDRSRWRNLLFHRDAQPFTADGRYIRNAK